MMKGPWPYFLRHRNETEKNVLTALRENDKRVPSSGLLLFYFALP